MYCAHCNETAAAAVQAARLRSEVQIAMDTQAQWNKLCMRLSAGRKQHLFRIAELYCSHFNEAATATVQAARLWPEGQIAMDTEAH